MMYLFNKVSFINFHGYGLCYSTTKLVYEASDNVKPSSVNQRSSMMSLPPARCMMSVDSGKCCHCPNFNHSLNRNAVVPIHESCRTIKWGKTYLLRIKCLKGTSLEMIVNSKHTCSYFHILSEWRAPSGLADRPAVGGLRPTGGAGESCLWKKVTESTQWETYPKHSYWECLCENQLTLHGRKAHVLIGERFQGLLKTLLRHFTAGVCPQK